MAPPCECTTAAPTAAQVFFSKAAKSCAQAKLQLRKYVLTRRFLFSQGIVSWCATDRNQARSPAASCWTLRRAREIFAAQLSVYFSPGVRRLRTTQESLLRRRLRAIGP